MKKKILALCLVVALMATAIAGATLAYFTDVDSDKNVMVTGNVDIIQNETDLAGKPYGTEAKKLLPAVVAEDGTIENAIDKVISVTNNGSEDVYVRTFIVFEDNLPNNMIGAEFQYPAQELWANFNTAADYEGKFWATSFEADLTVEGEVGHYEVWMFTYTQPLAPEATTDPSLLQVAMTPAVTNEVAQQIVGEDGELHIYAFSQAVQAEGFDSAEEALEAAFPMADMDDAKFSTWLAEANLKVDSLGA